MKALFILAIPFIASAMTINLEEIKKGNDLNGWEQGFYGKNGTLNWTLEEDATATGNKKILKQTGQATYGWLVKRDPTFANGSIEADLKVISGKEDPEVGLVWRHKDGKNYYYVRINATEDNVIFYRMNKGKKELVKEADAKVGFNNWHHLKVTTKDDQIDVYFDQKPVISIRDSVFKTAGRAGLFTTADTVGAYNNVAFNPEK